MLLESFLIGLFLGAIYGIFRYYKLHFILWLALLGLAILGIVFSPPDDSTFDVWSFVVSVAGFFIGNVTGYHGWKEFRER